MIYHIVNTSYMFTYTYYIFQVRLKIIYRNLHCFL